jgi:uncharacterized protein (UPF0179 family)
VCHPRGLDKSMRFRVVRIDREVKCPEGQRLVAVSLE